MRNLVCVLVAAGSLSVAARAGGDVRSDGAFGFPQKEAVVLCDTRELRVSAFNDAEHLYVQAVVWNDPDNTDGETEDGRAIGDNASLMVDSDADERATAGVDRNYALNPWPKLPGLHYSVVQSERSTSGLTADSKGRGAISYVAQGDGKRVRVDAFLIPLAEIGRSGGQDVRLAYYGSSPHPALTVNSVGFESAKRYYSHALPRESYHAFTLAARPAAIDVQKVPEGRGTIALKDEPSKPMPGVGSAPPEVAAGAWLNWGAGVPPTLERLRGKVIVVEFWATWCGPCVQGIPHLNEVQKKYRNDVVILSLTDQKKEHVEGFFKERELEYVVGVRSKAAGEYGVRGIPHAFVIGRDGMVAWHGHPGDATGAFEKAVKTAVGSR